MKPIKYISGNRVRDTDYTNGKEAGQQRKDELKWIKDGEWYLQEPQEQRAL